jgi:hypothetical protein
LKLLKPIANFGAPFVIQPCNALFGRSLVSGCFLADFKEAITPIMTEL